MKVLWFSNTSANSDEYFNTELKGTGGWLKALDKALQNHVELHIAFYKQYNTYFKYNKTTYHPIYIKLNFIKKLLKFMNIYKFQNREDLSKYLEIINLVKPDVIHIHGTENKFISIIPHTNIPIVVSIQGNLTIYLHKFFNGFERKYIKVSNKNSIYIKKIFNSNTFANTYKWFKINHNEELKYLKTTKNIIGRTDWDKRISRIMAPESNYYHIDELLRDSFYKFKWEKHSRDYTIIHSTNGNTLYKGFETLCQALYELNKTGYNCIWYVAGISPDDLIVRLTKKKLKDKYPSKGLVLMGNLNENDLLKNLLNSDLYVMPSHIENSPNNLCEAMILGLPIISTFVGGVGSLIKDNEEGILIQDGDPWVMAGAIIELINDNNKAIRISEKARTKANKTHNVNLIIEKLLSTYNKIIVDGNEK